MKASVIIPAYNSADTIEDTLKALEKQTERDFEIIVVDDGSTDEIREIVAGHDVKLFNQEHRGPAAARNRGAIEARGEILVFTDSDCVPTQRWLAEMLKPFSSPEIVGVQGRYKTRQRGLIPCFVQCEIESRYERMSRAGYIDFVGSYSAAYRRILFLQVGGFDESFSAASGEDPDLSYRLSKKGYKMVFNGNAVVYHRHPASLGEYLRKKFYRAYWRVALYKKHAEKAVRDSYTPQLLKVQIGAFYAFSLALLLGLYTRSLFIPFMALLFLLITALPESLRNLTRDVKVGIASLLIIIMRTAVFGAGLIYGLFRR
jgi:glycosyltransferase involved in cell wall biosynthesis